MAPVLKLIFKLPLTGTDIKLLQSNYSVKNNHIRTNTKQAMSTNSNLSTTYLQVIASERKSKFFNGSANRYQDKSQMR